MIIRFEKEKETKNTIRFREIEEPGEDIKVGSIYIQKDALNGRFEDGDIIEVEISILKNIYK